MTDEEYESRLERQFPAVKWRTPMKVLARGQEGWACRYCVAKNGLLRFKPLTLDEFRTHLVAVHYRTAMK